MLHNIELWTKTMGFIAGRPTHQLITKGISEITRSNDNAISDAESGDKNYKRRTTFSFWILAWIKGLNLSRQEDSPEF